MPEALTEKLGNPRIKLNWNFVDTLVQTSEMWTAIQKSGTRLKTWVLLYVLLHF